MPDEITDLLSTESKPKKHGFIFWLLIVVAIFLIAAIGYLVYNFFELKQTVLVSPLKIIADQSQPTSTPTPVRTDFNILIMGYGGGNHDGAYLTDSMILAHLDFATQKVSLISIPRDLWVKIPFNGDENQYGKINSAYAIGIDDKNYSNKLQQYQGPAGGGVLAKTIVSQITGLPIDKFVAIDFNGFTKSIDALGGVDVNVEKTFTDTQYPIEGKETELCGYSVEAIPTLTKTPDFAPEKIFTCRYETVHFDQGVTHMDGSTALKYVRSRHSLEDGTDFGRSKRQQSLIVAVKNKIFSIDFITKVIPFMSTLKGDFKTDLTLGEIQQFISKASNFKTYSIKNYAITDQNFLEDSVAETGAFILQPTTGIDKWEIIQSWINNILTDKNTPAVKTINCSNQTDLDNLTEFLDKNNYFVIPAIGKCTNQSAATSVVTFDSNLNQTITDQLKTNLGLTKITNKPVEDSSYNILITIGNNYNTISP